MHPVGASIGKDKFQIVAKIPANLILSENLFKPQTYLFHFHFKFSPLSQIKVK